MQTVLVIFSIGKNKHIKNHQKKNNNDKSHSEPMLKKRIIWYTTPDPLTGAKEGEDNNSSCDTRSVADGPS